jgi:ankyrin repeat protein
MNEGERLLDESIHAFAREAWDDCIRICRAALSQPIQSGIAYQLLMRLAASLRFRAPTDVENLVEASHIYVDILGDDQRSADEKTRLHLHLGKVYFDLARMSVSISDNLSLAAYHYEEAIKGNLSDEELRASVASHLGFVLMQSEGRAEDQRIMNLGRAREYLIQARSVYALANEPVEFERLSHALTKVESELGTKAQFSGSRALIGAAEQGELSRVRELVADGVDVNSRDEDGCTALHRAISEGFHPVAAFLIERGADVIARDNAEFTLLHWAVFANDSTLMDLGFVPTVGVDPRDTDGRTPLSWAVSNGWSIAAEWLLDHHANPDAADADGWTPLHHAAANNQVVCVRRLLNAGVNRLVKNTDDEDPLDVAVRLDQSAAVAALRAANN